MTPGKLRRRIAYWQRALGPLGVGHWKLSVDIVDEPRGQRNSDAGVFVPTHYDTARMEFRREHVETCGDEELDCTIVHELVHLALRDLREVVDSSSERLSPSAEALFDELFDHEMEGVTDRFARTFVALHNAN